jgi:hypothetical protein
VLIFGIATVPLRPKLLINTVARAKLTSVKYLADE